MGSTPTAGSVPCLCRRERAGIFRCSSDGKSVRLKSGRSLARDQPPELKGVEILSVSADYLPGDIGILRDGKKLTLKVTLE